MAQGRISNTRQVAAAGFFLCLLLSFCAASSLARDVPADFTLTYSSGPTHGDWGGGKRLILRADGTYLIDKQPGRTAIPQAPKPLAKGRLKPKAVAQVYREIQENGFWLLKAHYRDPKVRDGYVISMLVKAQGRSHRVSISNLPPPQRPPQVSAIMLVVRRALPKKHRGLI